jgi:two-component system chemotaxis response regulator CheY
MEQKSVLIVDDSPVMCSFLKKIFEESGYKVAGIAHDGAEAVEKFEQVNPDLVTLDIIMPKLKGTEVLRQILEKEPAAKVVMASSVSDAKTVMHCLKIGAKRYIIKPYDREAVMHAVEKALGLEAEGKVDA